MRYYADLHTGRFTVIADFETTRQMELFHAVAEDPTALARLSLTGGVAATGERCLRARFVKTTDELIADGGEGTQWSLPRDWRDYDLLFMNVYAPAAVGLQLSLCSGQEGLRATADSYIPLQPGWNLLRLDLAEAAEHIALDDLREIRWSLPAVDRPTELLIDDIVLANNRVDLFGDSSADEGGLYVRCRGRRWDVGAGGRFELGVLNGQIKYWYDVAHDRFRVHNLLGSRMLGPSVITFTGSEGSETVAVDSFPAWGDRIVTRQKLLEASPARIVIASVWEFASGTTAASPETPQQSWVQTIYPNGDVYVHVECSTAMPGWSAGNVGLAVARRAEDDMNLACHSTSQLGDVGNLLHVPFAYACPERPAEPSLLFTVHDGRTAPLMKCLREPSPPQAMLIAFGAESSTPIQRWDCLLALGLPGSCADTVAQGRALQYGFPPTLTPTVGRLATDAPGDEDHDGFDEAHGCYVLAPDPHRVVLTFDGKTTPMYSPAFVIQGSAGLEAWVYLDYVIFKNVGRTAAGELVFQLPGTITTRRTLEVYLRHSDADRSR